ncbi:MAG: hypothetical protein KDC98_02380 [Planctomycetes bacterium]|nr:hypothetical protein [Planctomycetota bacterium]
MNPMTLPVVLFSCCLACCQESQNRESQKAPPASQEPDAKALLAEAMATFAEHKITVDLEAQTVTIPVVVNEPADPIEYLLIHSKGKKHEAMFITESLPSVLNGALLMVGLQPGQNATVTDKDPMPTREEVENGAETVVITPPKGVPFWMTVKWKTPEGKTVEHCIEDLILDLTTQEPVRECKWIYLGGRMARIYKNDPEVYVADFEGNLISACYMVPANHLATMEHARARDEQNWWLTNKVPAPGTEVQFVFHRKKTKLHTAREKRLAEEKAKKG